MTFSTAAKILGVSRQAVQQKAKVLGLRSPLATEDVVVMACLAGMRGRDPSKEEAVMRRQATAIARLPIAKEVVPRMVQLLSDDPDDPRTPLLRDQFLKVTG